MNLPTEIFGSVVVVHTPDELGSEQTEGLDAYLGTLERNRIVLDLDDTEMINSRGLTALLDAHDRLRETGGQINIATTNALNRKILEITRVDQQLEVFDSVIEAVKSFQGLRSGG